MSLSKGCSHVKSAEKQLMPSTRTFSAIPGAISAVKFDNRPHKNNSPIKARSSALAINLKYRIGLSAGIEFVKVTHWFSPIV